MFNHIWVKCLLGAYVKLIYIDTTKLELLALLDAHGVKYKLEGSLSLEEGKFIFPTLRVKKKSMWVINQVIMPQLHKQFIHEYLYDYERIYKFWCENIVSGMSPKIEKIGC